jgi:hypothetical protein
VLARSKKTIGPATTATAESGADIDTRMWPECRCARRTTAGHTAGAQTPSQLAARFTTALDVARLVDRLAGHVHLRARELRRNAHPGSGDYRPWAAQRWAARRRATQAGRAHPKSRLIVDGFAVQALRDLPDRPALPAQICDLDPLVDREEPRRDDLPASYPTRSPAAAHLVIALAGGPGCPQILGRTKANPN